jgi:hypothetical protein
MNIFNVFFLLPIIYSTSSFGFSSSIQAQVDFFYKAKSKIEIVKIKDSISANPVNTELLKIIILGKNVGYARSIATTTGCNSACLPLNYITFYDINGKFLKLVSKDGLTKIGHASFTTADYSNLEFILVMAPSEFSKVVHPKEMTDALSGATLKEYKASVVAGAAYSTLRIHLYNQNTINIIKTLK